MPTLDAFISQPSSFGLVLRVAKDRFERQRSGRQSSVDKLLSSRCEEKNNKSFGPANTTSVLRSELKADRIVSDVQPVEASSSSSAVNN